MGTSWSYNSLPDLTGKVALVTGGNAGLGRTSALELARKGATVVLVGRDEARTLAAAKEITEATGNPNMSVIVCNLADLSSVRALAEKFLETGKPLHILMNNAGVAAVPYGLSVDGIETQFATNHVSHFLLTKLLLPKLIECAPSRIVVLSSRSHRLVSKPIDYDAINNERGYSGMGAYGRSKLANIYFTRELTRQLTERGIQNVYVNAVHPGMVSTDIFWKTSFGVVAGATGVLLGTSVEKGALTQTFLAADPSIEQESIKGEYFVPTCTRAKPTDLALRDDEARRCWEWTENILAAKGF